MVYPKRWKRDMIFGAWNVRSLCRSGSLTAAARKLAKCKLDVVGEQEVRWDKGSTVRAGTYNLFCGKETKIINWEKDFMYTTE